uniref:Phorbol-ester/DAG-type domain-containing protein n=1 Tax=Monopterus albus TaxID=43700 RepID=A0A3Q3ICV6_MONAL
HSFKWGKIFRIKLNISKVWTMIISFVQEKEREKRDKDKEGKEKDKKTVNGHVFTSVSLGQAVQCSQCNKAFNSKEAFHCIHCNASVHKGCRDSLPICAKVKMKIKAFSQLLHQ